MRVANGLSHWDPTFRAFWPSPDDAYVVAVLHLSKTLLYLGYVDQARFAWFTEGFDTPVLQEAKALLDQLG